VSLSHRLVYNFARTVGWVLGDVDLLQRRTHAEQDLHASVILLGDRAKHDGCTLIMHRQLDNWIETLRVCRLALGYAKNLKVVLGEEADQIAGHQEGFYNVFTSELLSKVTSWYNMNNKHVLTSTGRNHRRAFRSLMFVCTPE
jgi:hypothetical protein